MAETASVAAAAQDRVLVIKRRFEAPASLVFKMFTQPEHIARWWGCSDSTVTRCSNDLRVGGDYHVEMRMGDGAVHRITGVYREVEDPRLLSFTWGWLDEQGQRSHETLVTVTFAERGQATEVTLRHEVFESVEERDAHGQGWGFSLDRLAVHLAEEAPRAA